MDLKEKIINLFEVVPIATREQLIRKFFSEYANPEWKCRVIMKQLHLDKKVFMNKEYRPYICFSKTKKIPQHSSKLPHHIDVVDFYLNHQFTNFIYEPPLGFQKDGFPRPDAFVIWFDKPYFIEVQTDRKHWTKEEIREKIKRYEKAIRKEKYKIYSETIPALWFVNQNKVSVYSDLNIKWG